MARQFKQLSILSLIATVAFATACESNLFNSRNPSPNNRATPKPDKTSPNETDIPLRGGEEIPPPVIVPPPFVFTPTPKPEIEDPLIKPVDLCPQGSKAFSVLIIDLKSGWFAGDGGEFFKGFIQNNDCKDSVKLSYMHVTKELIEGNISQTDMNNLLPCATNLVNGRKEVPARTVDSTCSFGSFNSYDQLWILGGSTIDPVDIGVKSKLFLSLVARASELYASKPTAGFFVGAGLRNSEHANVFVEKALPQLVPAKKLFRNLGGDQIVFPSPSSLLTFKRQSLTAGSGLEAGTFSNTSELFADLGLLADYEKRAGREMTSIYKGKVFKTVVGECLGNPILTINDKPVIDVLATDHCNQPMIGMAKSGEHKLVADGNMARFYLSAPEIYFHRIILSLL